MSREAITPNSQVTSTRVKSNRSLYVAEAIRALTRDDRLCGRFITADALSQVIKKKYDFSDELDFDIAMLNRSITKHFPDVEGPGGEA